MSELSREQAERLRKAHRDWHNGIGPDNIIDNLAPTVAAMLDEARAEVVRDLEAALATGDHAATLRVLSAAAGGPPEPRGA